MRSYLAPLLILIALVSGPAIAVAEGDFTQPSVAFQAVWTGYSVNRGDSLRVRLHLRSPSAVTREASVEYFPGQPVQVVVDGNRTTSGAIPAAISSAYTNLATAITTHVAALAAGGAFNAH